MRLPLPAMTRLCNSLSLVLLLAAPLLGSSMSAATHTYTGGTPPTIAAGDTVRISGSSGTITIPSAGIPGLPTSLTVNEWVQTAGSFNFNANNVTFEQEDKIAGQWAMIDFTGPIGTVRPLRLTAPAPASSRVITLDRIIVANGYTNVVGAGIYVAGDVTTFMRINGDLAVLNNVCNLTSANGGAGIATAGASLTFSGTTIIAGNLAGYNKSTGTYNNTTNGGGFHSSGVGTTSVVTFENPAFFLSNTAGARGGAYYGSNGNSLTFESSAVFANNTALGLSGGAIFLSTAAGTAGALTFNGDAHFNANISGASGMGGGAYVGDQGSLIVDSTADASGATVLFENNIAGTNGGGIRAGILKVTGKLFSVVNNTAGASGDGAAGGGISIASSMEINSPFDISHNQIVGSNARGGAIYGPSIRLNSSGTISYNIALGAGGGIHAPGDYTFSISGGVTIKSNVSGGDGGGMFTGGNAVVNLTATSGDIIFEGNQHRATIDSSGVTMAGGTVAITAAGTPNGIYFSGSRSPLLNLNAGAGHTVYFYDPIEASDVTTLTVTKTGDGSVVFNTHQSLVGSATTNVVAGSFTLASNAVYGSSTTQGVFTVRDGGILAGNGIIRADTLTLDSGAILKGVDGGNLRIEATNRNFATGFVLMGSGTITTGAADLSVTNITPGDGITAQNLTIADYVTLADNAVINIFLYDQLGADSYKVSDRVNFSGTIAGANHTLDLKSLQNGTFNLGKIGDFAPNLAVTINGSTDMGGRQHATLSGSNGYLILDAGADYSRVMTWTGANGTLWDATAENWTDFGTVDLFAGGDRVVFSGTADTATVRTIEIGGSGMSVSDMVVEGSENYTFTGTAGITARSMFEVKVSGSSAVPNPEGKLVMRGSGTLTFSNSAANIFSGGIDVYNGMIFFDNAEQLGTEGAPITFKGNGALRSGSTSNVTLANTIVIDAGKTASFQPARNHTMTLSGSIIGSGTLRMNTAGTLVLAGGGKDIGAILITGGTLQGDITSLTTSILNNSVLQIAQPIAGTFTGTVTGAGAVVKTGAGKLTLNDGAISTRAFNLNYGEVILAGGTPIKTTDSFTVAMDTTLSSTGSNVMLNAAGSQASVFNRGIIKVGRAAGGASYGKLTINGNLASETDNSVALNIGRNYAVPGTAISDKLAITGTLSGAMNVAFNQTSLLDENTDFSTLIPITAGAFAGDADVTSNAVSLDNGTDTQLRYDAATQTISWVPIVAPEPVALIGADVSSLMVGKAALGSLSQRLQNSRAIGGTHSLELWLNGLYARDKINASETLYEGSHIATTGAQAGADWTLGLAKGRLTFGVYSDFANADMNQDGSDIKTKTTTESTGFGAYASYRIGPWYFDALFRKSSEDYEIDVPNRSRFTTQGDATAAAFGFGVTMLDDGGFLNWEPQFQLTWQSRDIDSTTAYLDRTYTIDSAESLEGRVGVRMWLDYELRPGWRLRPYLRASFAYEFEGSTSVVVSTSGVVDTPPYDNTLRGRREIFDLGADMQIGKHIRVGAAASIYVGETTQGTGFDLNISYLW